MKPASRVQPMGMHLNDKELSSPWLGFPLYIDPAANSLIFLSLCASPYIKKHARLLSCNDVSAFNGRDKGFRRHQCAETLSTAITMSAEIFYILLIRRSICHQQKAAAVRANAVLLPWMRINNAKLRAKVEKQPTRREPRMSLIPRKPGKPAGRAAKPRTAAGGMGEGAAPAAALHLLPPGPAHRDNMRRPAAIND